jgi:hypothetical protein
MEDSIAYTKVFQVDDVEYRYHESIHSKPEKPFLYYETNSTVEQKVRPKLKNRSILDFLSSIYYGQDDDT